MCRCACHGTPRRCENADSRWKAHRRAHGKKTLRAAARKAQVAAGKAAVEAAEVALKASERRVVLEPLAAGGSLFVSDGEKLRRSLVNLARLTTVHVWRRVGGDWVEETEHPEVGVVREFQQLSGTWASFVNGGGFSTGDVDSYDDGLVGVVEGEVRTEYRLEPPLAGLRDISGLGGLDEGSAKRVSKARDALEADISALVEFAEDGTPADAPAFLDRVEELAGRVQDGARVLHGEQRDLRGMSSVEWDAQADAVDPGVVAARLRAAEAVHESARYQEKRATRRVEKARAALAAARGTGGERAAQAELNAAVAGVDAIHEFVGKAGQDTVHWRRRRDAVASQLAPGAGEPVA